MHLRGFSTRAHSVVISFYRIPVFADMDRSHGELTPSVMKKMVQLEAYNPAMNPHHNQRGLHLTRGRAHDSQGI